MAAYAKCASLRQLARQVFLCFPFIWADHGLARMRQMSDSLNLESVIWHTFLHMFVLLDGGYGQVLMHAYNYCLVFMY